MTDDKVRVRRAVPDDAAAVGHVLRASYRTLYRGWYADELLARVLPEMARPQASLLAGGRYRVALIGGEIVACGGWTEAAPGGRRIELGLGHIRHFAAHPAHLRQGAASAILRACIDEARQAGIRRLRCMSSLPAEPFYAANGFLTLGFEALPMAGGRFGVVRMEREL